MSFSYYIKNYKLLVMLRKKANNLLEKNYTYIEVDKSYNNKIRFYFINFIYI